MRTAIFAMTSAASLLLMGSVSVATENSNKSEFKTGMLIKKVVLLDDKKQSYALYLPQSYTTQKQWPILYCFSPVAKGDEAVACFRKAADEYGWIVVGSNDSRNETEENVCVLQAKAIIKDTAARFSINEKRRYAAGFSGGSAMALLLAGTEENRKAQPIAGVIACGGFAASPFPFPRAPELVPYYIAGNKDTIGYRTVEALEIADPAKRQCRLSVFDGGHQWPPPEFCTAAVRYMELVWQLKANNTADQTVTRALQQEVEFIEKQSALPGRFMSNHNALAALVALTKGTPLEKTASDRLAALEANPRYKAEKAAYEAWQAYQAAGKGEISRIEILMNTVSVSSRVQLGNWINKADIEDSIKEAVSQCRKIIKDYPNTEGADRANCELQDITEAFNRAITAEYARMMFNNAATHLRCARIIEPKVHELAYKLACAQAQSGQTDAAINSLKEAIDLGFKDFSRIRTDPALASLRQNPEYKKLLAPSKS